MKVRTWARLFNLFVLALTPSCATPGTTPVPPKPSVSSLAPGGESARIVRVVDGDTVIVAPKVRVRLTGIDTPESVDPRKPVQCFGVEASNFTKGLLPADTPVTLVHDVQRLDRYGRTLAYVYRQADGMFVNLELVKQGYAQAYTVPPNVAHATQFVAAQAQARRGNRGLWSVC